MQGLARGGAPGARIMRRRKGAPTHWRGTTQMTVLVTGGAGYFGEILCRKLLARGEQVRSFDLNPTTTPGVEGVIGDIRDKAALTEACKGAEVVYHNVAQVPLAKDKDLFWSVNRDGVENLVEAVKAQGVRKLVYTSSSAVFGVPKENPVTRETPPSPAEDYGKAKLAGEQVCLAAQSGSLQVDVVRPRTILGHGRLGILQILFDWISRGQPVPVFNGGHNVYQFVHADDLADACIAAGERDGSGIYNIGAAEFGAMRQTLQALIEHAGSGSRIKSVPMRPMEMMMNATSAMGLSPLGPYHALMYGRELYFDIQHAVDELGYAPKFSNAQAMCESYDSYLATRDHKSTVAKSHHLSPVKQGVLKAVPTVLRLMP